MDVDPSISTVSVWRRKVVAARRDMMPDVEAMGKYFASGKAGRKLRKLSEEGGDRRRRYDLRYLGSG